MTLQAGSEKLREWIRAYWAPVVVIVSLLVANDRLLSSIQAEQRVLINAIKGEANTPGLMCRTDSIERYILAHEKLTEFRVRDIDVLKARDEQIRSELANFTTRIEQISFDVRMIRSQLEDKKKEN